MSEAGLRLRHLSFHGPNRQPASLEFGPGLNVIYGASETGKSFIVEAVDYMLGGKAALRDLAERVGYDRILLGIETLNGEQFTLTRSAEGGSFYAYGGMYHDPPGPEVEGRLLSDQHNEKNPSNLSRFLLDRCDLDQKRVRKNREGATNSLSFRNLARLVIINENEIIQQRSPLSDGNPTTDTGNFATFKLLLTGIDDSALFESKSTALETQSRDAQLEILDQLLDEYQERLKDLTKNPEELEEQLQRIEHNLLNRMEILNTTESDYRQLVERRRDLRKRLEEGQERRSEIGALLERFNLLDRHYQSDVERLRGIEEGGTLFDVLGQGPCPLCGADPMHHKDVDCDANVADVITAARAEIGKIELLQKELSETVQSLLSEAASFNRRLPKLASDVNAVSDEVDRLISPKLAHLRGTYREITDKKTSVNEALTLHRTIQDIQNRRAKIEAGTDEERESPVPQGDLPTTIAEAFAQQVESILKKWHFPDSERVYFDAKTRDLIIAGKPRGARGKGLRAITNAAFLIGLLEFCRSRHLPHPGFIVLDSPLLAYRKPDGSEDDLRGTDLNERFYEYLAGLPEDHQVVIVENTDPPAIITTRPQVTMFTGNPHSGRYGFFPVSKPGELPNP